MTPPTVLIELLERLAAVRDDSVLVSDHDLGQWPTEAVTAMKSQKLVTKARASTSNPSAITGLCATNAGPLSCWFLASCMRAAHRS